MGMRIPIKIIKGNRQLQVEALLNTGFETIEPLISIPISIAEILKLKPRKPLTIEGPGLTRGAAYQAGEVTIEVSHQDTTRKLNAKAIITNRRRRSSTIRQMHRAAGHNVKLISYEVIPNLKDHE